jgi:hypothetical protein
VSERADTTAAAAPSDAPSRPAASPQRPDPRLRPPDPAGTQPKFDPASLLPSGSPIKHLPAGDAAIGPAPELPEHVVARAGGPSPAPALAGAAAPALETRQAPSPHLPRFQFLIGALGTLGIAAIVLAVSISARPVAKAGPAWAPWKPSGSGGDPAEQIAAHVAPQYLRAPGHQLVDVTGGPQAIAGQPVVVALRSSGSQPAALPEDGVFYQLCGEGPNCSIPGKASVQRGLLVRREALELALYTFHYIEGASQVIVTFPPPPSAAGAAKASSSLASKAPSRVLLFRPTDIETQLSRPLRETLSNAAPSVATVDAAPEAKLVDRITGKLLYDSILIPQQQSGSAVLLLQPPSIGG